MFIEKDLIEITIDEMADIHPSKYKLVDIRDEVSHTYGAIPNSECDKDIVKKAQEGILDKSISYVLYCMKGLQSYDLADQLRYLGYDAVSLKGG